MRSSVIADCTECNAARCRFSDRSASVQVGTGRHNSTAHDGVRASYDIEADVTIGAVLVAIFCAGMAAGGALVLGAVRSLGWR